MVHLKNINIYINMSQVNLSTKQKQAHTQRTDVWLSRAGEVAWTGSL